MWEALREFRLRWRALIARQLLNRDLDEEIRFHIEMRAQRNEAFGMTSREADCSARRRFGNEVLWKENVRSLWSLETLDSAARDIRYAARSLRKSPGFAVAAIVVLGLGIGSTTAIFSLVDAVLLRSLPWKNPDDLVLLWGNVRRQAVERRGASYPDYLDWKAQAKSFEGMAAFTSQSFLLTGVDQPQPVSGELVSAGYFELLGVRPILGQSFTAEQDKSGAAPTPVLLGENFWRLHFDAARDIVGREMKLDSRSFIVTGILPAGFRGLTDQAEVWAPFAAARPASELSGRGDREFPVLARLKQGSSIRSAQTEIETIAKGLEHAYPATNGARSVEIAPLSAESVDLLRGPLTILLGAVGFVLLIACANVANLLLARSEARRQEIAVRRSLGASRGRVLRQMLTESVLLGIAGGALGLVLSHWALLLLVAASPVTLPSFAQPTLNWMVAAFTVAAALGSGLLVGIAPALQTGNSNLQGVLKESSSRGGDDWNRQRFRSGLMVSEIAIAMTLLIGAGLLMRTLWRISAIEPGFDPTGVLTLTVSLPRTQTFGADPIRAADQRTVAAGRSLIQRIRLIPSVTSVSLATDFPFSGSSNATVYTAESHPITDPQVRPRVYRHRISPGYFKTLGVPIVAGRAFDEAEMESRDDVVIVTDNLAKRFWPGENAIGRRIKQGMPDSSSPWWTIVGVVGEIKFRGLPNNPTSDPDLFLPLSGRQPTLSLLIRSDLPAATLANAARQAIREVDTSIAVYDISPINERMTRLLDRWRFLGWLMGVFAAMALILASIGLYGLMMYTVRRRTREFGIRIALGASYGCVVGMVVRQGMSLVALGLTGGVVLAGMVTQALNALLYGVGATDPTTFLAVAAILSAVALAACYLPARRAARLDPIHALRYE